MTWNKDETKRMLSSRITGNYKIGKWSYHSKKLGHSKATITYNLRKPDHQKEHRTLAGISLLLLSFHLILLYISFTPVRLFYGYDQLPFGTQQMCTDGDVVKIYLPYLQMRDSLNRMRTKAENSTKLKCENTWFVCNDYKLLSETPGLFFNSTCQSSHLVE